MHIIYMYVYVCTCIKVNTDSSDVVRCGQRNLGFPAFHSCDMGNAFFNVSWGCFSINKPMNATDFNPFPYVNLYPQKITQKS